MFVARLLRNASMMIDPSPYLAGKRWVLGSQSVNSTIILLSALVTLAIGGTQLFSHTGERRKKPQFTQFEVTHILTRYPISMWTSVNIVHDERDMNRSR